MPAVHTDVTVEAGSYEPLYWTVTDPITGAPLDLTAAGYTITGVVASRPDGTGTKLLDLPDDTCWSRTADGRAFFEPPSATSAAWPRINGFWQATLTHPSGEDVRFAEGRFTVNPKIS